ncbi:hypothetical protein BGZ90_011625 [Linnemannia elongata]|nr:hypothetical protein BGZ90_011625 [Linnemannia elongata]
MILNRFLTFGLLGSILGAVSAFQDDILSKAGSIPAAGRPGPQPVQCTNPGFFCKSTVIFASANTSPNPQYRGGTSGPGALGGTVQADQFICPSSDAKAVRIASCPQGDCQQNYCVGGGPAKVPERLPSGSGLYCGKTLNAHAYGGGLGGGGGGGGGGGRPPHGEYVRNNLYYFIGSYGVNLGPCPYRCINAGPGTPDYCATSASQY